MKKFLFVFILGLSISACVSYDIQNEMHPNNRSINQKLPNMEFIFETGKFIDTNIVSSGSGSTSIQNNDEFATLFRREVEQNLIDTKGPVKGTLVLEQIFIKEEKNYWWMFTMLLDFIPTLCGVPITSQTAKWELELNVLDKAGKRIARYSGEAKDTEYLAAYWGYSNPRTAAIFNGYKKALEGIIQQLQNDIPVLSKKLN